MTNGTSYGTQLARPTLEAAAELGARADTRWTELDAHCRLPADLHEAALAARLFRTLVPVDMGGTGGTPVEWFQLGVELSTHEPSLGWVVAQGAAELGWIAAGADHDWAIEVLADPLGSSASTIAGRGELTIDGGTASLRGRWSFNSGVHGATWIGGLSLVRRRSVADDSQEVRFAWVPAERAEIVEDWDPTGMRGTGSHSIVIAEQEIDPAWTFSPFEATTNDRGPHRCLVGNGNWPIAGSVAATQLGAARRALDEATSIVVDKAPPPDFTPLADNASVQRALVRAEGLWRACRSSVEAELCAMWDDATRRGELDPTRRVSLFAAHATAAEQSVAIVNAMCELTGTVAVDRAQPLSRSRRDAQALQGHLATNGDAVERAGKVALGLLASERRV
ncbi:MAG: acyl-CoA dehydrogenase family protein [Acidimicrobiales bacterium]